MVGHTTKQMKHSRSSDIQIWWTRGWKCRVHHIWMSHSLPCNFCILTSCYYCYYYAQCPPIALSEVATHLPNATIVNVRPKMASFGRHYDIISIQVTTTASHNRRTDSTVVYSHSLASPNCRACQTTQSSMTANLSWQAANSQRWCRCSHSWSHCYNKTEKTAITSVSPQFT